MSDAQSRNVAAEKPMSVVGPDGKVLTLDDLPPPETRRWVARRKAEVVAAVRAQLLTLEEACKRYNLSMEEYGAWETAIDRHGLGVLGVTRILDFRLSADLPRPPWIAVRAPGCPKNPAGKLWLGKICLG
jgi:hypothetical protein